MSSVSPPALPPKQFARDLLQDAIAQRALNSRQLAELLSEYEEEEVESKTLMRQINRGTFDAGFFFLCLSALGADKVDIQGERLTDVHLKSTAANSTCRQSGGST